MKVNKHVLFGLMMTSKWGQTRSQFQQRNCIRFKYTLDWTSNYRRIDKI